MKTKKAIWALLVIVLVLFFCSSTEAASSWYVCTVSQTGQASNGSAFIQLTSTTGAWSGARWYVATGSTASAMLAVGLTALTNNLTVNVQLSSTTEWSVLSGVFCMQTQ